MTDESSLSSVSEFSQSSSIISGENDENVKKSEENEGKYQKHLPEQEENNKLKREVDLFSAVLLIVGSMIGSGLFISPKGVLQFSGSVGASLLVWIFSGVVALMGALCYAELGTAIPLSGSEYSYFLRAYGPMGRFGPIPAFLCAWMYSLIIKPATISIMLLTFAEYIVKPMFPDCEPPIVIKILVSLVALSFITFINCYSVKMATRMNNIFTVAKLLAITIMVLVGAYMLSQGHYEHLATGFEGTRTSFSDLAKALYFGLWAYDGWNDLNFVTEELVNPYVNLPKSVIIGIPLVTVCFLLTNISYITVLSPRELLASEAVAIEFANNVLGPAAFIIPILVAASAFGASNGTCLITARLPFAAARGGHCPELMSYIQVNRLTPTLALIFNGLVVSALTCVGNIAKLIEFFSFVAWMFYGGAMVTVVIMRYTEKDLPRPYKVPLVIPIVMSGISAYLVLGPLILNPQVEYFYALFFLFTGLIVYIPFVHYGFRLQIMKKLTHILQLVLLSAPAENALMANSN